jgi:flagellar biosynthesis/type III secretory pathway M-ring protein FliF/YscJ
MKKRTVFRVVLIVLCVLCTLSILQVRNILTNHRQNERDYSTDDSLDEDSPHDLVLPSPDELIDFADMAELYRLMLIETEYKFIQTLEAKYRAMLLHLLQQFFSPNQVHDVHIMIDMDIFNPTQGERNINIDRITVSVNIDGTWKWKYDEKGNPVTLPDGTIEREYTPVPEAQLRAATALVQNVIGYNSARGDLVTVVNIPFDRLKEFSEEDAAYFRKKQMQMTVMIILSGLTLLLISFIIFRGITGHKGVTDTKIP